MQQLTLRSDTHQARRLLRVLTRNLIAFGCLLVPSLAHAQSNAAGDLAITQLPALGAGTLGNAPPFQFGAAADLSELYTTNVLGSPAPTKADFDTRLQLSLNATEQSSNVSAAFAYTGSVDYFARTSTRPNFTNYLSAKGTFSILPDHILLSAQVFAQPQYQSQLGNVAPFGQVLPAGANGDFVNTYGFVIQPDLFFRLGDFLRSDLIPVYSGVYIDQPTGAAVTLPAGTSVAGNEFTKSLIERITSGSDFTRLQWGATASYTEMSESSGGLIQRSATGQLSYAITEGFSVVGNGGYQSVTANAVLIKPSSGPVIMGGVNFDLPTLSGQILAGEQYRSFSAVGHIRYQITPRMTLVASASDNVTTPLGSTLDQNNLLQSVASALVSGQVPLPSSGILTNSQIYGIGLESQIARIRVGTISYQYAIDDLTASLTAFGTKQSALTPVAQGQNTNMQSVGLSPSISYALSPYASVSGDAIYTDQTQQIGADKNIQFDIFGSYDLGIRTQLYVQGTYFERLSDRALAAVSARSGDISGTSIRLGVRFRW